ncbi:MAG: rhodanese-like domain-containing protein [Planctomycetaceae bacterium]
MAHTTDTLEQVKQRLAQNEAVLIDVREQDEWDEGHLAAATLVPLSELKAGANGDALADRVPKDRIVYCHCRSGGRVLPASGILQQLGYDIRPLKAGYVDLVNAGFEKAT